MLYERWRCIAAKYPHDLATGRRWTFSELRTAGEAHDCGTGRVVHPQGNNPEFILTLLAAWQAGKIVCPLELGQSPPEGADNVPANPIAHLKTTSATTGVPRCIAFTEAQLAADADNIVATMGLRPDWPNVGVISLAHSYGFSNLVTPLLLHGIPLILAGVPLPETVRRAATLARDVSLPAVPAMWRAWHNADAIPSNVRLAISAGAPLALSLEQELFEKRGLKIHNFYGASECGGIAYDAREIPRTDSACVGSAMRNVLLSVADDGCMEVRGGSVAETYWPEPEANLRSGCFHSSDLAEISDGLVYLRGRASDQINVAGRKVSPEAIEQVLLKHPGVLECLVFGVPSRDAERTEEIVAAVVSREREEVLRQFILETLPAWQAPRHWWFAESLAANERGKVSRALWRERWLGRTSR
jgi:acyl-CoA synthetase (AMP-forming)/AMP-acid ligase II